ncbi:MAG: phytanoyl-CoA dioxygenase family protein, partial [Rickettsiales bacterium]
MVKLTQDEVDFYHEHGYVVARGVITGEKLDALRRETDAVVAQAAGVAEHNAVYDLEDSHSPSNPRVRRLKEPYKHFEFFDGIARDPDVLDIVEQLLGPDIRLYGGKMNLKSAGYGAPVEWHQDWAFYPHTNDDVLATGLLLDDCDEANGPLMVMPGS